MYPLKRNYKQNNFIGEGITGNMIRQGFLRSNHKVLDVGCGLGRLARPLTKFLTDGEYHGFDITLSSVEWCQETYRQFPNFHFRHVDLFNTYYNTATAADAANYRFPYEDATFDFVMSTSLFTHMMLPEVDNYLGEMGRVLKPGGHCWNTFLVMDTHAAELVQRLDGSTRWYLPHEIDGGRVRDPADPSAQIAFHEDRIREIHKRRGLDIIDVRYGPWTGRKENVRAGGQDVIIARRGALA